MRLAIAALCKRLLDYQETVGMSSSQHLLLISVQEGRTSARRNLFISLRNFHILVRIYIEIIYSLQIKNCSYFLFHFKQKPFFSSLFPTNSGGTSARRNVHISPRKKKQIEVNKKYATESHHAYIIQIPCPHRAS